ncbi:MAG: prenyltransferase/squalene oxidase repeat-containing protein [Actinomycetes bacterium]
MVRRPRSLPALGRVLAVPFLAGLVVLGAAPGVVSIPPAAAACGPTGSPAAAATPRAGAVAAVEWLLSQVQPDGGFETAGFPGFETPDAVLAIATAAQTTSVWSTSEALAAVRAISSVCGEDPLAWLDGWSASGLSGGDAAKLVVLVAEPLGLPSAAFDPAGDGAPIDLTTAIAAAATPDGRYGTFNETIYAALALRLVIGAVPAGTVTAIRAGQHPDGGWDYTGDLTTATPADVNTTAAALIGLVAGGAAQSDAGVQRALGFLATRQQADGGWREEGDAVTNPNATALAALAIRTAGYDPDSSVWRPVQPAGAAAFAAVTGTPTGALLAAQAGDGHLVGPYDDFGLNTFGTSQGVQGLLRTWLVGALPLAAPATSTTTSPVATTTPPVAAAPARLANSGARGATATMVVLGFVVLGLGLALVRLGRRVA